MPRVSTFRILIMLVTGFLVTGNVAATQHLVRPGENWDVIDARLKPGDEIILMTGRHRPGTLRNAHGTKEQPITLRGLDPGSPPIIDANRYGLRLYAPLHLHVADLEVSGATINGILIDGNASAGTDPVGKAEPPPHPSETGWVSLTNVSVIANGPKRTPGQRHAIHLRNLEDVEVDGCQVEGWAGAGLEIVACRGVRVTNSVFTGLPEYVQNSGIRIRAGSERVRIDTSRFTNTGDQGVCIGARSKLGEFIGEIDKASGPRFEATQIQVRRCIFKDSMSAIAFVNAERSFVRHCTIIRPRRAVLSIRHEQTDPRFGGIHRCAFGNNVVVWEPGDISMLIHVGPDADASLLVLEQNVWWSPDLVETLDELGGFLGEQAFPQITDLDPGLDEALRPTAEAAESFGADLKE